MADSVATRVARHRAKQQKSGITRITLEFDVVTAKTFRRLCRQHKRTQRQMLELSVAAAASLLGGHLQVVAKTAATAPVVARQAPQERTQSANQATGNTNATPLPETTTPTLYEPEQATDDVDDRIRRAAASMES